MSADLKEFLANVEAAGLPEVKARLVSGRYSGNRKTQAEEWVFRKEQVVSAADNARQIEIALRATEAAERQAEAAERASRVAVAALIVAIASAILSIISLNRH
jgi:hypothetical protein